MIDKLYKIFFMRNRPLVEKISLWVFLSALLFSGYADSFMDRVMVKSYEPFVESHSKYLFTDPMDFSVYVAIVSVFAFIIFGGVKDKD